MNILLTRVRLCLIGGATLIFLGGLLVAIGHWDRAETDRAFVAAADRALQAAPATSGVRYWAPSDAAMPSAINRMRIEAMERVRRAAPPALPQQPASPTQKPPAAVR